jgi:ubiquinone/menaquinone biosynthesis C-methylase UbiE
VVPDVYATIGDADEVTQQRLAEILELRAADPQQQAMLDSYLSRIAFGPAARVLEIGCGTGAVTRAIARRPGVAQAIGVDPSPVFIARAEELASDLTAAEFVVGDGRALQFADSDFDTVVVHTTLCHVPQPESLLGEAMRVVRPGGTLAICDGDYATITVATGEFDPLQVCIEAVKAAFIHDIWLVRRLPAMLRAVGFELVDTCSHGYLQTTEPAYMLTLVDRGADTLAASGRIGVDAAAALKAEARRRVDVGEFFGFIGFASFIARKPIGLAGP